MTHNSNEPRRSGGGLETGDLDVRLSPDALDDDELGEALASAHHPSELDPRVHERLLALALEDPLAPASDEEAAQSENLRRALDGAQSHPDADLARALAYAEGLAAANPDSALSNAERRAGLIPKRRSNVIYVVFGATTLAAAAAAAVALTVFPVDPSPRRPPLSASAAGLHSSRSLGPLFNSKFAVGHTSRRLDRMADARHRDLRFNRFASWGTP